MSCPACGGASAELLAPGLARCSSIIHDSSATGMPPNMGVPAFIEHSRVCGCEYQVAPEAPAGSMDSCSCGTYAIGRCVRCAKPVCGYHSGLHGDERLCTSHINEMYQRQNVMQAEERRAKEQLEADERAEVARLIAEFFPRMATAGSPGLVDLWASGGGSGKSPESKWRTPPRWQGWLLGEVSYPVTVNRDGYGTATAVIGVTPDRQWLSVSTRQARKTRWVASEAHEDAASVGTSFAWHERLDGIAKRLRTCAASHGVSLD